VKALILSEGGRDIGFGHIARCTSLYQLFGEKGITPEFIVNGDESVANLLKGKNYQIIDWLKNREEIFCAIRDADIAIVDSYLADYSFYKKVSKLVKIPVYIGSNKRLRYPRGMVVKESLYAEELKYPARKCIVYLLGPKYAMLRREFFEVPEKKIKKIIKSIMITFGSNDFHSLTPMVMKLLNESYPELIKNVVIGNAFHNIKDIEAFKNRQTNLIYSPDAEGMKKAMLVSDICISAGGQTLYELARVGVPTIGICFAEEQKRNLESWQKNGFIEYAGCHNDKNLLNNVIHSLERLMPYKERAKRNSVGRGCVDGKGVHRIVEKIISLQGGNNVN